MAGERSAGIRAPIRGLETAAADSPAGLRRVRIATRARPYSLRSLDRVARIAVAVACVPFAESDTQREDRPVVYAASCEGERERQKKGEREKGSARVRGGSGRACSFVSHRRYRIAAFSERVLASRSERGETYLGEEVVFDGARARACVLCTCVCVCECVRARARVCMCTYATQPNYLVLSQCAIIYVYIFIRIGERREREFSRENVERGTK